MGLVNKERVWKPNHTPGQPPCAPALNSLDGSSRVFFDFGKKCTQKTDLLFLRAGKKVSKKTVPLVHPQESKILRIVGFRKTTSEDRQDVILKRNPKELPESLDTRGMVNGGEV